jgi:calcineurin-like phosphoesterase family protein
MKTLNKDKPILFLGDHHGAWSQLLEIIADKKITDCYLISVGDSGIGFTDKKKQERINEQLNKEFKNRGIVFMSIRGNHDDPDYFKGSNKVSLSNFELLEDYTIINYEDKRIQLIGGAISIDRTARREGASYWKHEGLDFDKEKCEKVDILVTHTAPSWCFPQQFNEMVYSWAREDAYLLDELTDERAVVDEIFKICQPTHHFYGHFHSSWTETVNKCTHKLLNINELYELRD